MKIIYPIESESFRFHVASRSVPGLLYLVDLEERQCGCPHWQFRIGPARAMGEEVSDCHHTLAAREWFIEHLIENFNVQYRRKSA